MITPSRSSRQVALLAASAMARPASCSQRFVCGSHGASRAPFVAAGGRIQAGLLVVRFERQQRGDAQQLGRWRIGAGRGQPSGIEPIAPALPCSPARKWLSITSPPPMKVSTKT